MCQIIRECHQIAFLDVISPITNVIVMYSLVGSSYCMGHWDLEIPQRISILIQRIDCKTEINALNRRWYDLFMYYAEWPQDTIGSE